MRRKAGPTSDDLMTAIRAKCLDCCGGSRREVAACREKCALNPYRAAVVTPAAKPGNEQTNLFDAMEAV